MYENIKKKLNQLIADGIELSAIELQELSDLFKAMENNDDVDFDMPTQSNILNDPENMTALDKLIFECRVMEAEGIVFNTNIDEAERELEKM